MAAKLFGLGAVTRQLGSEFHILT